MTCPVCGSSKIYVIQTIQADCETVHRIRKCMDCGYKFYTSEEECKKFKIGGKKNDT